MRLVIWLSVPVLIFCVALMYTMLMNWVYGVPYCDTWVRAALPYCR
jgi:hypothetical protein